MQVVVREPRLIPLREAAWMLDVHPDTLRRLVRQGRVPAVRLGERGWLKFLREDVRAIVEGTAVV